MGKNIETERDALRHIFRDRKMMPGSTKCVLRPLFLCDDRFESGWQSYDKPDLIFEAANCVVGLEHFAVSTYSVFENGAWHSGHKYMRPGHRDVNRVMEKYRPIAERDGDLTDGFGIVYGCALNNFLERCAVGNANFEAALTAVLDKHLLRLSTYQDNLSSIANGRLTSIGFLIQIGCSGYDNLLFFNGRSFSINRSGFVPFDSVLQSVIGKVVYNDVDFVVILFETEDCLGKYGDVSKVLAFDKGHMKCPDVCVCSYDESVDFNKQRIIAKVSSDVENKQYHMGAIGNGFSRTDMCSFWQAVYDATMRMKHGKSFFCDVVTAGWAYACFTIRVRWQRMTYSDGTVGIVPNARDVRSALSLSHKFMVQYGSMLRKDGVSISPTPMIDSKYADLTWRNVVIKSLRHDKKDRK